MTQEITAKVTSSTQLIIRARTEQVDLDKPLFAVNWFMTKSTWLYRFYQSLANRSVVKIGGKALFKGIVKRTILDEYSGDRNLLLIVKYPNGHQFKKLIESAFFKIVSIVRILAVDQFTFGFTQLADLQIQYENTDQCYLLHHFKAKEEFATLHNMFNAVLPQGIRLIYSAGMVADLVTDNAGNQTPIDSIIDGLVIFESEGELVLENMVESDAYQAIINKLPASYIGFINRLL